MSNQASVTITVPGEGQFAVPVSRLADLIRYLVSLGAVNTEHITKQSNVPTNLLNG